MHLSTGNSKTRDEALKHILILMPNCIAYRVDGSNCSCCLSEYFEIITYQNARYKTYIYDGYQKHANDCVLIRCSCNVPFTWKNICPSCPIMNMVINFDHFVPLIVETKWNEHQTNIICQMEQNIENEEIQKYIKTTSKFDIDSTQKNASFYFNLNK